MCEWGENVIMVIGVGIIEAVPLGGELIFGGGLR